ncbi:MAG: M20 aminoacylase family protein [Burkholderia contaminans]|uniref:M20 aminoacylase family protein n=6 Tax=Bacteria TaxID=2 RepID=A0AAP4VKD9_9BURK|nr:MULTISPECIES: M20 aminoacylase family protein [Burkholderia]MBD1414163.1 amidohydrolase [Burkholderia contaminans]MBH9670915.1 amidohydrolase [Burkholderia contaminans]MBH9677653.1 amidohydrolase [Burkholderia contaminans]MBH9708077.1 amidohydrolase [Burkholderia contaminans]MBH9722452.1 amidohydrolase [Burkholderia contaminans]
MNVIAEINAESDALKAIRRDIHAHPEVGYDVHRTAELVASKLEQWGLSVVRGVGRTGVVGTLKRGTSDRSIGLRADMDALPMQEANEFPHRSTVPGAMHACGHDGHTAMLLGAARHLSRSGDFDGTVHFIFQPAEEEGGGANAMIEDGLFDRFPVEAVFGVHNWPGIPTGHFGVRPGPIMASTSLFKIKLTGAGCHGAMPHLGTDPVFAAAQILTSLQSILTRNKNPIEAAALSVTQIHAGEAQNVVPTEAWLGGTVRTFTDETLDLIEKRMRAIVAATAVGFDCHSEIEFDRNYPPTVNDPAQTAMAVEVMRELVGDDAVNASIPPTMAAEDFSFMLRAKPGCYAFIGNGAGDHRVIGHGGGPCLLHNASYDFNDDLLPVGSSYFVRLVERFLRCI